MAHAQELVSSREEEWPQLLVLQEPALAVVPLPKLLTALSGQSQVSGTFLSESVSALVP